MLTVDTQASIVCCRYWLLIRLLLLAVSGIRGELQVHVKVDLFSDLNKFRRSSAMPLKIHKDIALYVANEQWVAFSEEPNTFWDYSYGQNAPRPEPIFLQVYYLAGQTHPLFL